MRTKLSKIAQAAALGLAITFTLSCSGGDPDDNGGGGGNGGGSCSAGETVVIGSQTWMKKNLNCNVSGSKCYDDDPANCAKYGRLYNWETAKKVCPSGWHLPSDSDWNVLMKFVNPSYFDNSNCAGAGTKLKATSGWTRNGNGTDEQGFAALPGGHGSSDGDFNGGVGYNGYWWSATEHTADNAYYRLMDSDNEGVYYYDGNKDYLFSVRCLQD